MALMNYTTTVPVEKTVAELQRMLARAGARAVLVDYDERGEPAALAFQIQTDLGLRGYRLPANLEAVHKTLTQQWERRAVARRFVTRDQAARVGWRILKDWTAAQLAIIETRMVTLPQVMLPWMIAGPSGESLYELVERRQLALPAADAVKGGS